MPDPTNMTCNSKKASKIIAISQIQALRPKKIRSTCRGSHSQNRAGGDFPLVSDSKALFLSNHHAALSENSFSSTEVEPEATRVDESKPRVGQDWLPATCSFPDLLTRAK